LELNDPRTYESGPRYPCFSHRRQGDLQRLGHSQRADSIVGKLEGLYVVILKRNSLEFVVPKAGIGG